VDARLRAGWRQRFRASVVIASRTSGVSRPGAVCQAPAPVIKLDAVRGRGGGAGYGTRLRDSTIDVGRVWGRNTSYDGIGGGVAVPSVVPVSQSGAERKPPS
jgi:hypothetical protein